MGQTVLPLGQNLLEISEKYNNEPYMFFIKVDQIFLKGHYGSTRIVPDSSFSKDLLIEINKESLRGQYGSDCYIF